MVTALHGFAPGREEFRSDGVSGWLCPESFRGRRWNRCSSSFLLLTLPPSRFIDGTTGAAGNSPSFCSRRLHFGTGRKCTIFDINLQRFHIPIETFRVKLRISYCLIINGKTAFCQTAIHPCSSTCHAGTVLFAAERHFRFKKKGKQCSCRCELRLRQSGLHQASN